MSSVGVVIEEIKQLSKSFLSCQFIHTREEGNIIAHELAKLGMSLSWDNIWVEKCPTCIDAFVATDVNYIIH